MISRRTAIAALCAAIPSRAQKTSKPTFGLQTYSLRYDLEKDFPGTLALIRKMGFEELEVSNWPGHTAAEYRRLLDDNGLKAVSMMASYQRLDKEVQAVAEDARQLGASYVVCSTLPQKNYMTDEECRHAAESGAEAVCAASTVGEGTQACDQDGGQRDRGAAFGAGCGAEGSGSVGRKLAASAEDRTEAVYATRRSRGAPGSIDSGAGGRRRGAFGECRGCWTDFPPDDYLRPCTRAAEGFAHGSRPHARKRTSQHRDCQRESRACRATAGEFPVRWILGCSRGWRTVEWRGFSGSDHSPEPDGA
jgi:hypothetical protein